MNETKAVIWAASTCSALAIVATLVVIPQLYTTMNELNARVAEGVQNFRVETDTAWMELVSIISLYSIELIRVVQLASNFLFCSFLD